MRGVGVSGHVGVVLEHVAAGDESADVSAEDLDGDVLTSWVLELGDIINIILMSAPLHLRIMLKNLFRRNTLSNSIQNMLVSIIHSD